MNGVSDLVPLPERGRRYHATRTVCLGDAGQDGLLRLDALARFLQDVGSEDAARAGVGSPYWVMRRTVVELSGRPRLDERIEFTTFCGGIGGRWAERRTTVVGPSSRIETAALWVFLDGASGRPAPLPKGFVEAYGEAAGGRRVSGRLSHPSPPGPARRRPWPLRAADFDVLGHVTNSAYWVPVEDELARMRRSFVEGRAEMEYRNPIEPGVSVELLCAPVDDATMGMWLAGAAAVHSSVLLSPLRPEPPAPAFRH